ncbi:hypothetical protein ACKI1I_06890 [Streptomyces turgidiscabies]|uniref:Uncharacterized protein n=1 Tax=Streptomyces turgidiscabies (strain Car8) TaxID=698760 RepID=L7F015_STRT8|nr:MULTISPECIES: hypothetical protein [Streptomyces]ELP64587.1 hypothetical protein STRTUCAR8_09218 [Streptomyces turgidiscabies Car8]MDX3491543.1 hypothetical protein [Streptomyces turgidiscabies]GAQ73149.1 hypothetical protein T45_04905 [Streptomyces turgidiscabies]
MSGRDFTKQYVLMVLLIATVVGLGVMVLALVAHHGLWESGCYGAGAFIGSFALARWVFGQLGLLSRDDG